MTDPELIGQHLLKTSSPRQAVKADLIPAQSIPLSEALNTYLTIKGKGKGKTFHTAAERACKYLVEATAHKHLHEYNRQDALAYRDYLITKGLAGSSISRIYNALNSKLNFTINEHALDISNPFSRVYFDGRRFVGSLQFGKARLSDYQKATGTRFTQDEFIADEALQDAVAAWHIADIDKAIDALGDAAAGYDRDGLRAVAHLGGIGGMKKYVRTKGKYNPADELGTSSRSYYDKFSTT